MESILDCTIPAAPLSARALGYHRWPPHNVNVSNADKCRRIILSHLVEIYLLELHIIGQCHTRTNVWWHFAVLMGKKFCCAQSDLVHLKLLGLQLGLRFCGLRWGALLNSTRCGSPTV